MPAAGQRHTWFLKIVSLRMSVYMYVCVCLPLLRSKYFQTTVDDIDDTDNSSITTEDLQKERKFLVFESCLMSLLLQYTKCDQEVELKTSVSGTLLVVTGSCPHGMRYTGNLNQQ